MDYNNAVNQSGRKTRRHFLEQLGSTLYGLAIIGTITPLLISCTSDPAGGNNHTTLNVDVSSLTSDNTGLLSTSPTGDPILIIRLSATSYETLLMICTHASCTSPQVGLQPSGNITCVCHGSAFDIHGNVVHGPAATSLTSYPTAYEASTQKVTITF